jgi:hypothetical protein
MMESTLNILVIKNSQGYAVIGHIKKAMVSRTFRIVTDSILQTSFPFPTVRVSLC